MSIITLADLKVHMSVTTDTDNDLLTEKIAVADEWISKFTGIPTDDPETTVPAPVKEAIRQLAAHLYENREATLSGVTAQELPFGLLDLLTPYREWAF